MSLSCTQTILVYTLRNPEIHTAQRAHDGTPIHSRADTNGLSSLDDDALLEGGSALVSHREKKFDVVRLEGPPLPSAPPVSADVVESESLPATANRDRAVPDTRPLAALAWLAMVMTWRYALASSSSMRLCIPSSTWKGPTMRNGSS